MSESHLIDISLSDVLILVELDNLLLLHGVDLEVLVGNDHLLIEVIDLLLFHLGQLLHHVVSRDENGVEVFLLGERWALGFHL